MVKPAHFRLTYSGTLGNGTEEFAISLNLAPGRPGTAAELTSEATAARQAWLDNMRVLFSNRNTLTETRLACITADGSYLTREDGSYQVGIDATPAPSVGAGVPGGLLPLQSALCVTLLTPRSGPTGKGRIFLPWPDTIAIQDDFRISQPAATSVATIMAEMIRDVNSLIADTVVSVVSSKGYTSPVTGVRVGRVPDTMRSRRGDLLEQPSTVLL